MKILELENEPLVKLRAMAKDLGIQNAMKNLYEIKLEKKALKIKMLELAAAWEPYRTVASKYLWKSLGT